MILHGVLLLKALFFCTFYPNNVDILNLPGGQASHRYLSIINTMAYLDD
ncbi:hypothetical protein VVMO6_03624 [Vibrio vulnificus MO6-24/O]|nr:hypothetical protein VVMO6_03624 [Vibrio vulnificus MO6-24/O]